MLASCRAGRASCRAGNVLLWLCLVGLAGPLAAVEIKADLTEIVPGVWAALQPEAQRYNDSNAVVVETEREVLVVDTQADPLFVRALAAEIRRRTPKPVRFVAYTHWHPDHTGTGALYRELFPGPIDFIAHRSLAEDVPKRAAPQALELLENLKGAVEQGERRLAGKGAEAPATEEERKSLEARLERHRERLRQLTGLAPVAPTLTFEDELTLHRDGRTLRFLHAPGHTRGDLVLFLPEAKVLVGGDLVDDLPFGGHGSPAAWLATLRRLADLDFEVMVPGHGPLHRGKEHLRTLIRLVETIRAQVGVAVAAGKNLESTRATVDLSELRDTLAGSDEDRRNLFDELMAETIERAWREARGEGME